MDIDQGGLYIGRVPDPDEPVLYESNRLTTHGVIVGMTGSGKTGLGIDLIEEALLDEIPCLIIDPKGDMGNLSLIFPDLLPGDFLPWIDEESAKQAGRTTAEQAEETAAAWRSGLEGHGIGPPRMRRVTDNAEVTIYTPGSAAGVGLNVLGSMSAPDLDWGSQAEIIRDEIEAVVSSLLVLAGVESDPVSGREHILLANIFETVWRAGKDLDLASLVAQVPRPPFRKLGVFDLDTFFPEKDRLALAIQLNGLLASPSFATWLEGVPLDIDAMLGGEATKAAVVYLSHLTDSERQFVVTLLLSRMVTWIRRQPGTSQLRALIYMDEVFGFAPPTAEPPSKKPILTILKQARAHGVGMVLATQNPIDLDYKTMSNAGTWMIGRLQTENDKRRILEGMESVTGDVDVSRIDAMVSSLDKRQFVLHSTASREPIQFGTRWAMSYLAGPLTREQVTSLTADRERAEPETKAPTPEVSGSPVEVIAVAPPTAPGIEVRYLSPDASWAPIGASPTGTRLRPAATATVQLHYDDTRAGVNHDETYEGVIFPLDGVVDMADLAAVDHDGKDFDTEPPPGAVYEPGDVTLDKTAFWTGVKTDLANHLLSQQRVEVFHNTGLGLFSRVGESEEEFTARCRKAAEAAADAEMAKLAKRFEKRIDGVKDQISAADSRVRTLESAAAAKQQEELMTGAGDLLGALLGGRKSSNTLGRAASRRAATQKAHARAETAADKLDVKRRALEELEDELAEALADISRAHSEMAKAIEVVPIGLEKPDIRVADVKLVWIPFD